VPISLLNSSVKQFSVGNVVEDVVHERLVDVGNRCADLGLDFFDDFAPILVEEFVGRVADFLVAVEEIRKVR